MRAHRYHVTLNGSDGLQYFFRSVNRKDAQRTARKVCKWEGIQIYSLELKPVKS